MPSFRIKQVELRIKQLYSLFIILSASKGFTLVELLVTISVIGIISVVSIPALNSFNQNQGLVNTATDIKNLIQKAKANAQSGESCSSTNPSSSWSIAKNGSSIELHCLERTLDFMNPIKDNKESEFDPNPAILNYICEPSGENALTAISFNSITYNSHSIFLQGCQSSDTSVQIKLSKGSESKIITTTTGGSINEE